MNAGLTSALLILVVYAQAATHGVRLTPGALGALLGSAFVGAALTLGCAEALLRPSALMHLLWLVAAVIAGGLASVFSAYFGRTDTNAIRVPDARHIQPSSALWRLCVCTNFCVLLFALPDPFMQVMPVQLDLVVGGTAAATGTAIVGGALLLIASALHAGDHARPTARHALMTVAVLGIVITGFAAWLPDSLLAYVPLPTQTQPEAALLEMMPPVAAPDTLSPPGNAQ